MRVMPFGVSSNFALSRSNDAAPSRPRFGGPLQVLRAWLADSRRIRYSWARHQRQFHRRQQATVLDRDAFRAEGSGAFFSFLADSDGDNLPYKSFGVVGYGRLDRRLGILRRSRSRGADSTEQLFAPRRCRGRLRRVHRGGRRLARRGRCLRPSGGLASGPDRLARRGSRCGQHAARRDRFLARRRRQSKGVPIVYLCFIAWSTNPNATSIAWLIRVLHLLSRRATRCSRRPGCLATKSAMACGSSNCRRTTFMPSLATAQAISPIPEWRAASVI